MILIWILGLKIIELYESTKACLSIVTMSYLPKKKEKLEMHKLGEGATGRHHEFMIVIEVNIQKVPISLMEVNKILWIIDSIE